MSHNIHEELQSHTAWIRSETHFPLYLSIHPECICWFHLCSICCSYSCNFSYHHQKMKSSLLVPPLSFFFYIKILFISMWLHTVIKMLARRGGRIRWLNSGPLKAEEKVFLNETEMTDRKGTSEVYHLYLCVLTERRNTNCEVWNAFHILFLAKNSFSETSTADQTTAVPLLVHGNLTHDRWPVSSAR